LRVFNGRGQFRDPEKTAPVYMAVRKMVKQVTKGEYCQLFFQQLSPLRTNAFQKLDRVK
jgi:hypothetical protein